LLEFVYFNSESYIVTSRELNICAKKYANHWPNTLRL